MMHLGLARTIVLIAIMGVLDPAASEARMLIAPMIEGVRLCESAALRADINSVEEAEEFCYRVHESAGPLISRALDEIGPKESRDGQYSLGYTYVLPLLSFFEHGDKGWVLSRDRIKHALATVASTDRSVVLYLFSTHFGTGTGGTALERELASEPNALLSTQDGPLPPDQYFSSTVFPWNFTDPSARINRLRHEAFSAVLDEICHLAPAVRARIAAVTMLGEVHQFFPNFFGGAGYKSPYLITDYSSASRLGFQNYLREKFKDIEAFNFELGTQFRSLDDISPPSKNINTQVLKLYTEHLDAYANGIVPIFGWAHDALGPVTVAIFLNGTEIASIPANLNRLDVFQAKPSFGTPNVGWRYDLDFSVLPPGKHHIAIYALVHGEAIELSKRTLVILDRSQSEPVDMPQAASAPVAHTMSQTSGLEAYVDSPSDLMPVLYNPLARLWNEFRNVEVQRYLSNFGKEVGGSCIGSDNVFTHEIAPRFNASWNPDLFAVDAALRPSVDYHLGLNLYGGTTHSDNFFAWLKSTGFTTYGVPEFHPMEALPIDQMIAMFDRHRLAGARFISPYFVSVLPSSLQAVSDHNKFKIADDNPDYGSASVMAALRLLMIR